MSDAAKAEGQRTATSSLVRLLRAAQVYAEHLDPDELLEDDVKDIQAELRPLLEKAERLVQYAHPDGWRDRPLGDRPADVRMYPDDDK